MDRRSLATNLGIAVTVQGFAFVVSAVTAFVVPKVLGTDDFGYWQLFLFYVGFLGFSQVGISDGAYLRYGGQLRTEIDQSAVVQQFFVVIVLQILAAGALLGVSPLIASGDRLFILVCLTAMVPAFTAVRYWGFVFQAMNETKLFSFSVLIQNGGFFIVMVALILGGVSTERPYVVAYVIAQLPALIYCLCNARDFFRVRGVGIRKGVPESFASVRVGFKLLLATLSGNLILGAARFVIDAKWSIETFGAVSLSITVVTFFLTLMAQAALVLFPALRQADSERRKSTLLRVRGLALLTLPGAYVLYFPMVFFLTHWLPSYAYSFRLAALIMPICIFDGSMQVLYSTYFKVVRRENTLMGLNIVTFGVCVACVVLSAYLFESLELVLLSPALASMVRGLLADHLFCDGLEVDGALEVLINVAMSLLFVVSAWYLPSFAAGAIISVAFVMLLAWRRNDARWISESVWQAVSH